jgi:phosphoglycolate phosphatase-like HAD superfamily hydrolase
MSGTAKTPSSSIPSRKLLAIVDRDATIYSSQPIAYACYQAAFDEAIEPFYPGAARLDFRTFTRDYNPFERFAVYKKHYPGLTEDDLKRAGEASWNFYLAHREEDCFNPLIPGMDKFLRRLKAAGHRVVILTAADIDDRRLRERGIPLDGFFSMYALKAEKKIKSTKREAIFYLLSLYGAETGEAVTIGDAPLDHVPEVLSVGTAFDLGCSDSRDALRAAVRIYASRVSDLFPLFGLGELTA